VYAPEVKKDISQYVKWTDVMYLCSPLCDRMKVRRTGIFIDGDTVD